jgi:hypothetical protein
MVSVLKKSIQKISNLTILLTLVMLISACAKTDREEQAYQLIQQGVDLAEGHNLSGLMELTQDSFSAGPGNRSRQDVRRILFVAFKRLGKFSIHHPKPNIRVSEDGERAIVKMKLLIASQAQEFPELKLLYEDTTAWIEAIDQHADIYTLSMELEYESNNWLVKKASISGFAQPHGRL